MLRNIPALLSPDLLHTLRAMGHGDTIVIADANFPAHSNTSNCLRLDGISATDALKAILTVMPLDNFTANPAQTMQVVGDSSAVPEIVEQFQTIINQTADHPSPVTTLERFAFYEQASAAFAIVQTGETRLYGNIILTKGIIAP